MNELLKQFINQTVRIYTISGVDSYLGTLQEVGDQHIVLRSHFKADLTYLAIAYIESFKTETLSKIPAA